MLPARMKNQTKTDDLSFMYTLIFPLAMLINYWVISLILVLFVTPTSLFWICRPSSFPRWAGLSGTLVWLWSVTIASFKAQGWFKSTSYNSEAEVRFYGRVISVLLWGSRLFTAAYTPLMIYFGDISPLGNSTIKLVLGISIPLTVTFILVGLVDLGKGQLLVRIWDELDDKLDDCVEWTRERIRR